MKKTDIPARKPVPFAANGSRRDLTDKTPTGSNQASYDAGFPPVTMVIKAAGGLPPDGRDFNQAFNELYAGLRWQNAGGSYPFDADFAAAINGYPAGVKLPNSTGDGFWLNTVDGNTNNPEVKDSALTGWVPVNTYGTSSVTGLTAGTVTLSTLQASKSETALSGTLTGNITLIVPAWQRSFNVTNNCLGNFTVTLKTSTGNGLALATGRNNLYCDGKNITAVLPVASLTNAGITQLSNAINSDAENLAATPKAVKDAIANAVNIDGIYPVGIVTWFAQNKDPNTLFPGTTWKYIGENRTVRLANANGSDVMTTGGSDSVTLTTDNLPAHAHAFSANTSTFDYGTKQTSTFDYGTKQTDVQGNHTHAYNGPDYPRGNGVNSGGDYTLSGKVLDSSESGAHVHNVGIGAHSHTVGIGAHYHSLSGTTVSAGSGAAFTVINAYIKLMAWYRSA